jgi:hypothetical protein
MLALLLAVLTLSALGGSSKGSTESTAAGAKTPSTSSATPGVGQRKLGGRLLALRECLQRDGITLPSNGGLPAGLRQPPKGVTRAQLQAAIKKCAGAALAGAGARLRIPKLNALKLGPSSLRAGLARFAACMREH